MRLFAARYPGYMAVQNFGGKFRFKERPCGYLMTLALLPAGAVICPTERHIDVD